MSYGPRLRAMIEALLCGEAGTSRTLAPGRFHRHQPDAATVEGEPQATAERAIEVVLSAPRPNEENCPLDGFGMFAHDVTVRVHYALTHAGGDMAEGLTSQHGSGTLDDVRDRASTDAIDVAMVLEWYENWSTDQDDPHVCDLAQRLDGPPGLVLRGDVAVLELSYRMTVRARLDTQAYAP